ncbi:MAG: tetratricopeptide repeat protein [Hyphomonadaceae bacterium]|nr:tetratricopeptide repeat protein [Hyphomonadaceae bacterium]
MRKVFVAGIACFTMMAGTASAQAIIIGGGMAKDCFLSVQAQSTRFSEVEDMCSMALESEVMTRANRAATYVNRGIIRMRAGNYDDALSDYDRALSLREDLGAAYLNRGAALILAGDHAAAKAALDRAIELGTNDLHAAHYNRAIAKEHTGDVPGAYYDFREAAELKPDWDLPQLQLERFTVSNG